MKTQRFLPRAIRGFAVLALFRGALAAVEPVAAPAPFTPSWVPSDGANHPLGVGKGIFPGRVVWIRDLAATPWDGKTGHWWDDGTGINQTVVSAMMSKSLRTLSGAASDPAAWEALFRYHNRNCGRGDQGYVAGEKIALKINCNNAYEGYGDADNQAKFIFGAAEVWAVGLGTKPAKSCCLNASFCAGVCLCDRPQSINKFSIVLIMVVKS